MSIESNKAFKMPCVLIIDENPAVRKMLEGMLQLLGVYYRSASDANEAFEIYEEGVDLVLIDMRLDLCHGLELTECLRTYDEKLGRRTPIIGNISAVDPESFKEQCLKAGMDAVYPKLTSIENLYSVLMQWLNYPLVMPVKMWDIQIPTPITEVA